MKNEVLSHYQERMESQDKVLKQLENEKKMFRRNNETGNSVFLRRCLFFYILTSSETNLF